MKPIVSLFFFIFALNLQAKSPVETIVPIEDVFTPIGFDSNDNSEVVISGWLPNLCYKSPKAKLKFIKNKINIEVKALKSKSSICIQTTPEMIVPFIETVDLGVLDPGQYQITVNGSSPYTKNSSILINESSSHAIDDFIYANVHYIEQKIDSQLISLKGFNPSDCFVLDEVKFVSNGINTYSVLPLMKKVRDFCPMKLVPFSYDIKVPDELNGPSILLHVRSMDGNSVNTLFLKSNLKN